MEVVQPLPARVVVAPAHPLHRILGAYPLAFFTGAFATDIAYAKTADMLWANFSAWQLAVGLLMGGLAAVAGIVSGIMHRRPRKVRGVWLHRLGTALVLVLALVNMFVHSRDAYTSVVPVGLALSGVTAVLVILTSWVGARASDREAMGVL